MRVDLPDLAVVQSKQDRNDVSSTYTGLLVFAHRSFRKHLLKAPNLGKRVAFARTAVRLYIGLCRVLGRSQGQNSSQRNGSKPPADARARACRACGAHSGRLWSRFCHEPRPSRKKRWTHWSPSLRQSDWLFHARAPGYIAHALRPPRRRSFAGQRKTTAG